MLRKIISLAIILIASALVFNLAKIYLADILYKESLSNSRLELAQVAYNLFPQNPHFMLQLAKLQAANNKAREANYYTKTALSISPSEINFYKQASQIYVTLAIKQPTYLDDAINTLKKAESLAPTDPVLPYQIANLYSALNKNQEAISYYQKSLALKPNYDQVMLRLAKKYEEQKNYSEAKKLYESAIKINPANSKNIPSTTP